MKAVLKFDLEDPDDKQAHLRCTKSLDISLVLWDIMQHFRKEDTMTNEIFSNIVDNYNIDIYELTG